MVAAVVVVVVAILSFQLPVGQVNTSVTYETGNQI